MPSGVSVAPCSAETPWSVPASSGSGVGVPVTEPEVSVKKKTKTATSTPTTAGTTLRVGVEAPENPSGRWRSTSTKATVPRVSTSSWVSARSGAPCTMNSAAMP